ncbi:GNAT family N-acetyltransferase [Candidatus Enterococcus ikei]|uniref:GNAT family N-acetyltransferase n=1 Tax=Candidatus Enterococcus ikei TaxID=2815326 RepID=A0ABS3GZG8_9ENTE|nr:GNAT family N-acetyltransferase [Enterococcus sp. DIV0869a]MBO0440653.1 GNAT family N-acetyltransferase [Enterococcus sp. DIV0869a]
MAVIKQLFTDVAIDPDYQGSGLGRVIMENLLARMEQMNIILYASPGKEAFYQKFDFRLGKTTMLKFVNTKGMKEKGFTA